MRLLNRVRDTSLHDAGADMLDTKYDTTPVCLTVWIPCYQRTHVEFHNVVMSIPATVH